jgi:signal transduction histidine kinase
MRALIPRSLRWQVIVALFSIVVVTISVSWFFASYFTARDFESFVTMAAIEQTREYAHLLETQYNLQGEFGDLAAFLVHGTTRESIDLGFNAPPPVLDDLDALGWDEAIASELGISLERYWFEVETSTPEELAWRYGSSADALVAAIMRQEVQNLEMGPLIDDADTMFFLSLAVSEVELYVEGWYEGYWVDLGFEDVEDEFGSPLLYEAPILVVNMDGDILFNGSGNNIERMSDALNEIIGGFPIRDWSDGSPVGYVLSAREPWFYDADETIFLGRTREGLLMGGLIAATIALVLGAVIARQISRPVSALRKSAVNLASGNSVNRLPVTKGELGAMSSAFNAMADSLDQQREVRSRMISDLSHELNTPLSVIQLEVEALRDGMQTPAEAVAHVLGELNLLRNLATDVGTLAENEAGLLSIQKESVALLEFLPIAAGRWKTQAAAVDIALKISVPEGRLFVDADPTRISQALGNLIRNALQHTRPGGTIEITCARRPVDRLGGIWNTVCVHDSGVGIAPEDLDSIFERSIHPRENRTGRGLGLTIVRQIVEAHGGHVWAESAVGIGSSFCIALR